MKGSRAIATLLLVAPLAVSVGPAPASCAAPEIALHEATAEVGENVTLRGHFWHSGCNDTGSCTVNACGQSHCDYGPEERPLNNIALSLTAPSGHDRPVLLGTADANERFAFTLRVEIPNVAPGRYLVVGRDPKGNEGRSIRSLRIESPQ